jgi:uncharacterized protein
MAMAAPLLLALGLCLSLSLVSAALPSQRPDYSKRTFHSKAIDDLIDQLVPLFADQDIATLFANCLPNTLDTTVYYTSLNPESLDAKDLDSFVITGDIPALWLRDSMNQVLPYLPYAPEDAALRYMIEGLINRHARSVKLDPFANAFNFNSSGDGHQDDYRFPPMTPAVFEGKYEIDSLNAFLKLSYWHRRFSGPEALRRIVHSNWLDAVQALLKTGRLPYLFY